MSSIERKMKRKNAKKEKKNAKKEMAAKAKLMGNLPENCVTCQAPFDKTDMEQVMSWNVVVRTEEEKVNLYCPDCWTKAVDIINGFYEHLKEKMDEKSTDV